MPFVLTVIAAQAGGLRAGHCAGAASFLGMAAAPDWLAPGQAADLVLPHMPERAALEALRADFAPDRLDLIVQPATRRRKRVLIADMEGTVIDNEMLEEMAEAIGKRAEVADITRRSMNGEVDFSTSLQQRIALMAGIEEEYVLALRTRLKVNPGAKTLVQTMRASGAECWLVTGGFTHFSATVAALTGFTSVRANQLDVVDGKLTGRLVPPILDGKAKETALRAACTGLGVELSGALTVGDGANDLPMLLAASAAGGLGVGYRPKPNVAAQLINRLHYADFTALLYAQGYREEDIRR